MDHGPPPNPNDLFEFTAPVTLNPMTAADQNEMMALYDSSMFTNFDGLPMSLDGLNDMTAVPPQSYPPVSAAANPQVALIHNDAMQFTSNTGDSAVPPAPSTAIAPSYPTPAQPTLQGGSTLTEFTKRRNWPAKVVEELKDFLQILDAHGRIKYASPSVTSLTGYGSEELVDRFVKDLIHPDDLGTFTSDMNESIATGNPLRMFYRLKKKDGSYAIFESVGHAHIAAAKFAPNPENQSPFCQSVFMMSRPYPTKNASLLDSFLEHKIENERLRRRIAELRREEEEEEASQQSWFTSQEGRSDIAPSEDTMMTSSQSPALFTHTSVDSQAMPPPERPTPLNVALTRENLEGVTAGNRPDSIRDKMARYEGASHTDTIEMLTGLRYVEGERSRGITTGNSSPTLIKGDVGIAIPIDRDPRTGEKKKKLKVAEEYVCTDCGTLDSPEWRKGPQGPKTLCNACGLRWAKKEKKKNANSGGNMGNSGPGHLPIPIMEQQ
ncbi:Cutinase gene palindrome-binding protein [Daldinia childiae]|uniref:Cutinase gene palindrome-binding protein n=1 Tax=Daldinia childiae TaxID=326645 RepID=UPI001445A6E1|nr:Cutinase gene palindrome-binding protein [Daldinia childiae]KAF3057286.1 Cutinase gene palindrome-binding protein [Daldinia childiae]